MKKTRLFFVLLLTAILLLPVQANAQTEIFFEDFNDWTTVTDDGWTSVSDKTGANGYNYEFIIKDGFLHATPYGYAFNGVPTSITTTKPFVMSSPGELTFDLRTYNGVSINISVLCEGTTYDVATFNDFGTQNNSGNKYKDAFKTTPAFGLYNKAYIGKSIQLVFTITGVTSVSAYYNAVLQIDNVKIVSVPTCDTPTNLKVTSKTGTSVDLSWSAGTDETNWEIITKQNGTAVGEPIRVETIPSASITGLAENTEYTFEVCAICDADKNFQSNPITITVSTTGGTTVIPTDPSNLFYENFNSITATGGTPSEWLAETPSTWDAKTSTIVDPYLDEAYLYWTLQDNGGYEKSVYATIDLFEATKGQSADLKSKSFVIPGAAELSFYYKNSMEKLDVYALVDGTEVAIATNLTSPSLTEFTKTLDAATFGGKTVQLIFRATVETGEDVISIDEIKVTSEEAISCPAPIDLQVKSATTSSIDLIWATSGDENEWRVTTKQNGTVIGTPKTVNTTKVSITNLTKETEYTFEVATICGADEESVPEIINASTYGDCATPTELTTSDITANSVKLTWTAGNKETKWRVIVNTGSETVKDYTVTTNSTTVEGLVQGTAYTFIVKAICNIGNESDAATIDASTVCTAPTISIATIESTSASFTVTSEASSVEIVYDTKDKTADDCANKNTINNLAQPITISELNEATEYVVYVRSICYDGYYSEWNAITFKTLPGAASVPHISDFENDTENNNWILVNGDYTNHFVIGDATSAQPSVESTKSLYISNSNENKFDYSGGVESSVFAYREINFIVGSSYTISFDWKFGGNQLSTIDYMRAFITTDINATINNAQSITNNGAIDQAQCLIDEGIALNNKPDWNKCESEFTPVAAQKYYIVFYWHCEGATPDMFKKGSAAIDNLTIDELACPSSRISQINVTDSSATISISSYKTSAELRWDIQNKTADNCSNSLTITDCSEPTIINGLMPNTEYVAYVRTLCDVDSESKWSKVTTFKTECNIIETIKKDTISYNETYNFFDKTLTKPGTYKETLTAENGCDSIVTLELTILDESGNPITPTDVDNITVNSIVVAPNPIVAGETAYISGNIANEATAVFVYNSLGQLVLADNAPEFPMAISGLNEPGIYFVKVVAADGKTYNGKLIVNN